MSKIVLLFIIASVLTSCFSDENIDKRDFTVYIPEVDIYMTTSKRKGGDFYVMFDNKKKNAQLSDSIDYIKFKTKGDYMKIIFDTVHKDKIYIVSPLKLDSINQVKYNFELIYNSEWGDERIRFLDFPDNNVKNSKLKPQYRMVYIEAMYYSIDLNGKTLKKGNVLGGMRGR